MLLDETPIDRSSRAIPLSLTVALRLLELSSNVVDEGASSGGGLGFEFVGKVNSDHNFGQKLGAV
jgi:hypothetical protein